MLNDNRTTRGARTMFAIAGALSSALFCARAAIVRIAKIIAPMNTAKLRDGIVLIIGLLFSSVAHSTIFDDPTNELSDPTIAASHQAFNGGYSVDKVFDDNVSGSSNGFGNVYATGRQNNSQDAFIEFDFGSATTIGGFVFYQRGNNNDTVFGFDLIFDDSSDFSSPIQSLVFATSGVSDFLLQGDNAVNRRPDRQEFEFASGITAQYVRWSVNRPSQTRFEGAAEMEFWATPVPEPSTTALLALGLLGVGFARKRRSH